MSDEKMTAGQEQDAADAYLAEVRSAAALLAQTKAPSWGTVPRIKRMIGYAERLADAVEAALKHHQDDGYGRCVTCREFCTCIEDALPKGDEMAWPAEVYKRTWDGWSNCTHGNEPFPCKEWRDITKALTGEASTVGILPPAVAGGIPSHADRSVR